MDSNNCGKVCLFSCLGCIGLIVVLVVVVWIASCAGCSGMFGGIGKLFQSIGHTTQIQAHFAALEAQGWEVDDSRAQQPAGYGTSVEAGVPMIWRARENPDDEWIDYVWELQMGDPEDLESLFGMMALVPRTEAALEVHEELGLPLPEGFELEEWDVDLDDMDRDGRDRERDRDRDRDEDDRDTDRDEDEGDTGGRRPGGKSLRPAA